MFAYHFINGSLILQILKNITWNSGQSIADNTKQQLLQKVYLDACKFVL